MENLQKLYLFKIAVFGKYIKRLFILGIFYMRFFEEG